MKVSFGIYLAFSFALYCWHITTFVLGVFLAEYFDVSDTGFDLKSDIKKAAVCSFFALTPTLFIYYHAPNGRVLIIYLLLLWFSSKLAYLRYQPRGIGNNARDEPGGLGSISHCLQGPQTVGYFNIGFPGDNNIISEVHET